MASFREMSGSPTGRHRYDVDDLFDNNVNDFSPSSRKKSTSGLEDISEAIAREIEKTSLDSRKETLLEQRLRLEFEEEKEMLLSKHKEELRNIQKKVGKKLQSTEYEHQAALRQRDDEIRSLNKRLEISERSAYSELNSKNEDIHAKVEALKEKTDEIRNCHEKLRHSEERFRDLKHSCELASREMEDKHAEALRNAERERKTLIKQKEDLLSEMQHLAEQHQNAIELFGNLLEKKQEQHAAELARQTENYTAEKQEQTDRFKLEKNEMTEKFRERLSILEDDIERERIKAQHEKEISFREKQSLKSSIESMEIKLQDEAAAHESYVRKHAIKAEDYASKQALRKLLVEAEDKALKLEHTLQSERLAACRKLDKLELKFTEEIQTELDKAKSKSEEEKNKLKSFFAERKQEYLSEMEAKMAKLRGDYDEKLDHLRKKEDELREQTLMFRESMIRKQDDTTKLLETQKDNQKREASYLHETYDRALRDQEATLRSEQKASEAQIREQCHRELSKEREELTKLISDQTQAIAQLEREMKEQQDQFGRQAEDMEMIKQKAEEQLISKIKLMDSMWRTSYKQVKHLRCVVDAFKPAVQRQWNLGPGSAALDAAFADVSMLLDDDIEESPVSNRKSRIGKQSMSLNNSRQSMPINKTIFPEAAGRSTIRAGSANKTLGTRDVPEAGPLGMSMFTKSSPGLNSGNGLSDAARDLNQRLSKGPARTLRSIIK